MKGVVAFIIFMLLGIGVDWKMWHVMLSWSGDWPAIATFAIWIIPALIIFWVCVAVGIFIAAILEW